MEFNNDPDVIENDELDDSYAVSVEAEFELAPLDLFIELVNGEFGPSTGMTFVQSTSDPRDIGR